tara:strand:- start:24817 stop:26523 length:1707 start_codon:yes stop_codon:yes gene_type:complete
MVADLNPQAPEPVQDQDWPLRSWGLALLGALVGLAIHHITLNEPHNFTEDSTRLALATFLGVAGIGFAFVVERGKIRGSALFALIAGLVIASVLYWSGDFTSWEPWRLVSALLTVAIAAPLFQGWRDGGSVRWHIPYIETHNRAWTNICLWFASWAFVGTVFLLVLLLGALFDLIGIDALKDLIEKGWFAMTLAGAAFGGAAGLLRDHERIVRLLQRVVMLVLSVLAPVLAVGLVLFLLALPFTGLGALWETTKSTTPIVLSCVIGALILANAVIGDRPEDEAKLRVMRWSAMALGVTILPLGIIAAISTGLRIDQYGLTPERLWAVMFTAIACAYGLAYLVSVLRGRETGWTGVVRPANMRLALALCAIAFLLSTPLISFGAISTRDQLARLESGKVSVDQFDFAALRFDFGPAGMKALKKLAKQGKTKEIRTAAADALKSDDRYAASQARQRTETLGNITTFPKDASLPQALRDRLAQIGYCTASEQCNLIYRPDAGQAILIGRWGNRILRLENGAWAEDNRPTPVIGKEDAQKMNEAFARGKVEIRSVPRQQVFIDGKPVGDAFE